ncbi:MAG: glycosyltransferase [Candidatus Thiodiazotropha sp.]
MAKSNPRVSVVVPNYNHAKYLRRRVESILNQTYQDFELILLDDNSPDNSRDIIEEYSSHEKVSKVIINEKNTGIPFIQWNRGVRESSGELIWIAESDDACENNLLQTLVDAIENHQSAGVAYCQSRAIDENDSYLYSLNDWTANISKTRWQSDYWNRGQDECANYLVRKCTIPNASAVLFKKAIYEKIGYADTDFKLSGDWMLWAKLLMESDVVFCAKELNHFRVHTNTVRSNSLGSTVALQEAIRIYNFIKSNTNLDGEIDQAVHQSLLERWIIDLSRGHYNLVNHYKIYKQFKTAGIDINKLFKDKIKKVARSRFSRFMNHSEK